MTHFLPSLQMDLSNSSRVITYKSSVAESGCLYLIHVLKRSSLINRVSRIVKR
jgi:hypothetical protein